MYRLFDKLEIARAITIYAGQTNKKQQLPPNDISIIEGYIKKPTTHKLINILINPKINNIIKQTLVCTVNGINFTSIKAYKTKKHEQMLWAILEGVDLHPVWSTNECIIIASYLQYTGANTKELTDLQRNDVSDRLTRLDYNFELSATGSKDIMWADEMAGADGLIHHSNEEIYLYLRYGTASGGSQDDRWRGMYSISSAHQRKKFIFIVDGVEALLQINVINKCFKTNICENAIWTTAKLLHRIDIENFKLTKHI
jgi:hypothetical protein